MIKNLSSVGVNPSGFSNLLCTMFYAHIAQPQLEYGLAINRFMVSQLHALEEIQNNYIKKIYGAQGKASTKVMLHIPKLFLMSERVMMPLQRTTIFSFKKLEFICEVGVRDSVDFLALPLGGKTNDAFFRSDSSLSSQNSKEYTSSKQESTNSENN
ncbi:hypothetical protein G6F70_001353 [Rhizopus microsporus]|nr:hypothetical protein G6F71_001795 [Rhizopus microsporus]KAG1203486.1 hypothetical protein G6F70_001353 [Rhizopus microsporus]KAG1215119.1 hypothetical protein G6F69_001316 [Rhizopus microsporus]KAG1237487.1 hypothetical protein G6F67_001165 [Rhizopus microsporus]KAG1267111.1 hypothetical protein G6F68_002178 [Rhizopus microsporus]